MRIYNTLTNEKELFEPVEPGKVGIYVCGPTVYKESHIDAFKKYLTYKGYDVKLVINITDVDDKIINEADELGISTEELAEKVGAAYFEAMEKLGVNSIDFYPRATEHIGDIIHLIQQLGERDAAYAVGGDVYFDITKCREYGKLSKGIRVILRCGREPRTPRRSGGIRRGAGAGRAGISSARR